MAIVSHTTTAFLKHCYIITFLFHFSLFLFYITLTFSSSVLRFLLFCFSWCSGHRVKTYVLPPSPHSVILTMKELERIKRESLIKSEILSVEEKKKENINRVERDFIANERKSKMRSLEAESLLRDERTDVDAETRGNDQLRRDVTMETVRTWVRTHVRTWTCCYSMYNEEILLHTKYRVAMEGVLLFKCPIAGYFIALSFYLQYFFIHQYILF